MARRWLIIQPDGWFELASRACCGRSVSARAPCGGRTPSPAQCHRAEEEKRSGARSPLSLTRPPSSLALTRLCLASLSPLPRPSEQQRRAIAAAPPSNSFAATTVPPSVASRALLGHHLLDPA